MTKLLAILATLLLLSACEQQKQASSEVGAVPKQILDKATNDINAAQAPAVAQGAGVSDQQHELEASTQMLPPAAADHRRAVQAPLASGVAL